MIDWLNYHHLHYFWVVAREGGITPAAELLHLSQPTLSTQIQKLEQSLGVKLFDRSGRSLVLTDTGQMVFRYAEEIFGIGRELTDAIRGRPTADGHRLVVGVPDGLPKLLVYKILKPVLALENRVHLICREGEATKLLNDLAMHRIDVVLSDSPLTPQMNVRAFNHLLGECDVTVLGTKAIAAKYRNRFPKSLDGAPMLLPTQNTTLRRALEHWFDETGIRPTAVHEIEDSALLKVFGQAGEGMIVVPTVVAKEVELHYTMQSIGRIDSVLERFYAISIERRLQHPAVVAISESARQSLFQSAN